MQCKHAAKIALGSVMVAAMMFATACGTASSNSGSGTGSNGSTITVLAAENEYGDVAKAVGGSHVSVTSIISSPDADPHEF